MTHEEFKKYPRENIEDVRTPFSVGGGTVERDMLVHTIAVTDLCIKAAESMKKNYGIKINMDHLIAGALLHDMMKMFEWKNGENGVEPTGIMLDHTMLGVAEFYSRGLPENVIHMIASHFGETGPTPPRSYEALILHYVDTMLSLAEFHSGEKRENPMQLLLLDDEMMKKMKDEMEKGS